MKIYFNLHCQTSFGQNIILCFAGCRYDMFYTENFRWVCEVESHSAESQYQYILIDIDGKELFESPIFRPLPKLTGKSLHINDEFRHKDIASLFRTVPFTSALCKQKNERNIPALKRDHCLLLLNAPAVEPAHGVAVVGESELLGRWNAEGMMPMTPSADANWYIQLPTDKYLTHSEFKFVVYDRKTKNIIRWEEGANRRFQLLSPASVYSYTFRQTYDWHGAGVAIPVFSLRSSGDWGVGEFYDLKYMVDWAVRRNLKLIQILPVNDTVATFTKADSYPYKANSVYALHPMYMNVMALGKLKDARKLKSFLAKAAKLNSSETVDYVAVNKLKNEYMQLIFRQEYDSIVSDADMLAFVDSNEEWLKPYAAFCCLRDKYGSADYSTWGSYSVFDTLRVNELYENNTDSFLFCYFVQYHLSKQLKEMREYAHAHGVVLKGDLPIGISADSVDAWMYPQLFNLGMQAGAPPDDFSEKGQNWGFPTYNWSEMENDGFLWWQKRFANMSEYFDVFRIDHILGFFRIWEIPSDAVWGLLGHFNPAMPMSVSEIEQYGMWFDSERFTKPYISIAHLKDLIPDDSVRNSVINKYFNRRTDRLYSFKEHYDSQRKIVDTAAASGFDDGIISILLSLHTEVLFIEDDKRPGYYNPRISVTKTNSFQELDAHLKWCISRIHDEYYYHRHNEFWHAEAMRKLPALLKNNRMLVCGEDLGMVPDCVPDVMRRLFILSLEIERMPKDVNRMFVTPDSTPYLSVSSTGTHDTSTLRGWWRENAQITQRYYNEVLHEEGVAPADCTAEIAKKIVDNQMHSNSMWSILPWQDFMACDADLRRQDIDAERINIPSDPHHYWCYRIHLNLD